MKTRLVFRFLHTCLLGCLLAATTRAAYADGEGGPLRFTVRVGAGIKGPVSGRLLVFFGPLLSASEEMTPGFGADTDKIWIAAREVSNASAAIPIELDPDEIVFPAPFATAATRSWHSST
jgi:hypothetical protein